MTATERITMVVLNDDGSRDKVTLSSWVGIPRKHELMWIGDDPYMIIEVEYAVSEGFFGARSIDAAGVYVRRLTKDEALEYWTLRGILSSLLDSPLHLHR